MGCDIHTYVERQTAPGHWECVEDVKPFDQRNYGIFGFLADVRNYSAIPPIAEPRGLPRDLSQQVAAENEYWGYDAHSHTWLSARELADFDYDQAVNDRRVMRNGDGGVTGTAEEGTVTTFREFLGRSFMDDVRRLRELGDLDEVRVVMWFDN